MKLENWNDSVELTDKKIICFGIGYLFEKFLTDYAVAEKVYRCIDNDPKKHGKIRVNGNDFIVDGIDEVLCDVEIDKCIFVITATYFHEIFNQLVEKLEKKDYVVYYYLSKVENIKLQYSKKYSSYGLKNLILFRSGPTRDSYIPGTDFGDNARALYEYMISEGLNKKYKIVWYVKNPQKQQNIPDNVEFISMDWEDSEDICERELYYEYLYTAKYIFFTDAYGFASFCKPSQIRIQLWHGCGFKTRVNFCRCEKRYEYTTVVSDLYAKIHADIFGLRQDQVLVTGYAKHDWLFMPYQQPLNEIFEMNSANKYVFWCPTFRMAEGNLESLNQYILEGETGLPIIKNEEQLKHVNEILRGGNTTLMIKLHPFQKKELIRINNMTNIRIIFNDEIVEKDLQINRILASADALISDYSSIAIDFLNRDKPIAFTLDDIEIYQKTRGFIFDNIYEYLPGYKILTYFDFCSFLNEIIEGRDSLMEKRKTTRKELLKYMDANNCQRIVTKLGIS